MKNLIKYSNRKIYDPDISGYVTLDQIRDMILSGHDISVSDSSTGKDITAYTLAKVLSEVVAKESRVSARIIRETITTLYNDIDAKRELNYTN